LSALRLAGQGSVSGAELSHRLSVTRAAIWARIEELRSLGYVIEASPHQGYRLIDVPDVLHADDLLSLVNGSRVIGRDIRVFEETTSTNDVVERLARDGVREGVVVFCGDANAGQGTAWSQVDFARPQRSLVIGAVASAPSRRKRRRN